MYDPASDRPENAEELAQRQAYLKRQQDEVDAETRGEPEKQPIAPLQADLVGIKALADACTPEAVAALRRVLNDPKTPASAIVAAANALLDRAHGKPAQAIDVDNKIEITIRTFNDSPIIDLIPTIPLLSD